MAPTTNTVVAAVAIPAAAPTLGATSKSWMPDSNVLKGGLAGVLAWAIVAIAAHYGLSIPPELQALIPIIVGWLITYILPPNARDIAARLNDHIVQLAASDPSSDVSERTVVVPQSSTIVPAAFPSGSNSKPA
jgi:hypothetical protein